ncbi:DNA alkylation repair protein [Ascidiimonas aurantiaca]|uniref:DNA alkylation repair protein n=1 Tax=Ascidiimonas aurantiaca TaxID=1685432 RepID=UPI0030EC31BA
MHIKKEKILSDLREELIKNSDEKTKRTGHYFFKEQVQLLGVKTATVRKIAKEFFKKPDIKTKTKAEVFALCEQLWQSGYIEESFIACEWSLCFKKQYTPDDFPVFEGWVSRYVDNWASCDTLCNHTIGAFLEMYPEYLSRLKEWARSDNRWVRRAAAVSLIVPARKGLFLEDILAIADILLLDTDDLVQKGYGWMLKSASNAHSQAIFEYVMRNQQVMPRTSLRYAIEKLAPDLRKEAMKK